MTRFTLRQLEIFDAVMQTGQVRAAAEMTHLSQAAVSQALQELALTLDVTLFERQGRAIVPTRTAHRLLELSYGPRAELDCLEQRLKGHARTTLAGPVHIVASSTIARYLLPALLARLTRTYPDLRLTLSSGNSAEVEQQVAAGHADLGFIEGPPHHKAITARQWRTDQLEIIGPPHAPRHIEPARIADWPWVMREAGSGTREVFEHSLGLAGLNVPPPTIIMDDSGAQVRTVAAGGGLACVSRAAAASAVAAGDVHYIAMGKHTFARPLWSIRRAAFTDTQLASTLLAVLAELSPPDVDKR